MLERIRYILDNLSDFLIDFKTEEPKNISSKFLNKEIVHIMNLNTLEKCYYYLLEIDS